VKIVAKIKIKSNPYLYPLPVVLIGANINNKPNFMALAWITPVEHKPPLLAISVHQSHKTYEGIEENKTFSVNIPSEGMIKPLDYCGIKSGKEIDKSEIFEIFYGNLKTAPMIKEAPLTMECRVVESFDTKAGHQLYIGEVANAFCEENCLENKIPSIEKIKPLIYAMGQRKYWSVGKFIGKAWKIGKNFKKSG